MRRTGRGAIVCVIAASAALGCRGLARHADTLTTDVAWVREASPHRVTRDVVVADGATLRVEAGSVVSFARGARLIVRGRLLAEGREDARIRFEGEGWKGIAFVGSPGPSLLRHVDVTGTRGMACIDARDSGLDLFDVKFPGARSTILEANGSSLRIERCVFPRVGEHEVIHGASIPAGGVFLVKDCTFHPNEGFNDIVDFSRCRRPGPIPVFEGNVFLGGGDDGLDLDDCDAVVSGNFFTGFHQDRHEHTSEAISTDNGSRVDVADSVFVGCDHGCLAKGGALLDVRRCVFVGQRVGALNFRERAWPPGGARVEDCVFWRNGNDGRSFLNRDVATELVVRRSLLPEASDWPDGGNRDGDPLFVDEGARDFRLRPESPWFGIPHARDSMPGKPALDLARRSLRDGSERPHSPTGEIPPATDDPGHPPEAGAGPSR